MVFWVLLLLIILKKQKTNQWYGVTKIVGTKIIELFREQYGCNYESLMPTKMYGPNDNYHNQNKYVLAKKNKLNQVEICGTGHEISIKKLALKIKKVIKFRGKIIFNSKFTDGTPKKILDSSKIYKLGWKLK